MTLRDLALEGLEQAINQALRLDPQVRQRLAALHGRILRIDLQGTGLQLNLVAGHDGRLRLLGGIEGEPEATLSGSPLDLLRAGDKAQGHRELFAGRVRMSGDRALAQRFSEALAGIDIDWEEQLSHLTGDIAAHEIMRGLGAARHGTQRLGRSLGDNLSEYLTEEEDFLGDVDELRDAVERLEARIALLERKPRGEPS